MNATPFGQATAVEVRPTAWLEDGKWFARVDFYFAGKPVGKPRILRDQPQPSSAQAEALARGLAESLNGKSVS